MLVVLGVRVDHLATRREPAERIPVQWVLPAELLVLATEEALQFVPAAGSGAGRRSV